MNLQARSEVPIEETWDLSNLYPDLAAFEADKERIRDQADQLFAHDLDAIKDPSEIARLIRLSEEIFIRASRLQTFAHASIATDMTDTNTQQLVGQLRLFMNPLMVRLSDFDNFLDALPKETLEQVAQADPTLTSYIEEKLRFLPYRLSDELETALVTLNNSLSLPYHIYEQAKLADMTFPEFEYEGETYPLSFVLYENHYQYHTDTGLRRKAFEKFSDRLRQSQHTIAAALIAQVEKEKRLADMRGYDSVFDFLLNRQQISRAIYDQHIDTIFQHLAPVMRKWAGLLKEVYQLDRVTFADLQVPLDANYAQKLTIDQAKDYARSALRVMGEEYNQIIDKALDERWVDWAQNIGKSTGGFCTSPYGHNSYILMSWTGALSDVFTLVHELGHAGHFQLANKYLNLYSTRPSTYFVEAPSTINEMLLTNDLINQNDDPRFQRFVYSSLLGNTYYHNYVTHFLEAHFQREVYRLVEQQEALTTQKLHELKKATLSAFWGEAVEIDDNAALTWMRQPHYYMGLYPYTYSAGLSIGTVMSRQIVAEGQPAVDRWIEVLKSGGTKSPVELAQLAGVDITQPDVLIDTIQYIESLVDASIELTKQLESEQ
ncbi:MAG TPA: oligoendopeptidase F [Tissierellia bacterium]|nr:oligoendopeptidase F [Tissierellia bacterium]